MIEASDPSKQSVVTERELLESLTSMERRLFAGPIRYFLDQMRRDGTPAAKIAARQGPESAIQLFVARQVLLPMAVIGYGGAAAITAAAAWKSGASVFDPLGAALLICAGLIFVLNMSRIRESSISAKQFKGSEHPTHLAPQRDRASVSPPRTYAAFLIAMYGLETLAMAAALVSARYTAPRLTGLFFLVMGLLVMTFAVRIWQKSRWGQAQPSSDVNAVIQPLELEEARIRGIKWGFGAGLVVIAPIMLCGLIAENHKIGLDLTITLGCLALAAAFDVWLIRAARRQATRRAAGEGISGQSHS